MARPATDIVLLAHDRLDHLVATVDALESRTRTPFRLTVVDNASGPRTRAWLTANRPRFERLILRPTNEHVAAFEHGIRATDSDPFMLADPDLVVPEQEPDWLERMLALMDAHPDFGLIGVGLDPVNRPSVLPPEAIDPARVVGDAIVEENVGTWFQTIRRGALREPYYSDAHACDAVRAGGRRVGWAKDIRVHHLGWDDHRLHPEHVVGKHVTGGAYPAYAEVDMIARPPRLRELAVAGPVVAQLGDVPAEAVLELAWGEPAVAPSLPGAVAVQRPAGPPLPFERGAAGAVVLLDPPSPAVIADACRVATRRVLALTTLAAVGARAADELAPDGWHGAELPATGDAALAMAAAGEPEVGYRTLSDREAWLKVFGAAAFGPAERRLFRLDANAPGGDPERVDVGAAKPWRGEAPAAPRRAVGVRAIARDLRMRLRAGRGIR
jgi:hypothetical protein